MLRRISVVLTVALCLSTVALRAQFDSGQISGYVRDASQAVIAGATVLAVNEGNGEQRQTTTNQGGYYVFPNLTVGSYTVSAEAAGFKKSIQTQVGLSSAGKLNVDLIMTVGALSESVEVKGEVAHHTPPVGFGIRFLDLSEEQLQTLRLFIDYLKDPTAAGLIKQES